MQTIDSDNSAATPMKPLYPQIPMKSYFIQQITSDQVFPKDATQALWSEFGVEMDAMLQQMGGGELNWQELMETFFDSFETFLSPNGAYYIAYDYEGRILGHAAVRRAAPGIAECKHMFVRPFVRGVGLGRALTEQRIKGAQTLGLRTVTVDTFRDNVPVRRLYESLGFVQVPSFDASGTLKVVPELQDYIVFYRKSPDA